MNLKKLLGNKIKQIRNSLNMTQEEFSEYIGISRSSLGRLECGQSFPSTETLEQIRSLSKLTYSEIFSFENDVIPLSDDSILLLKLNHLDRDDCRYFIQNIDNYINIQKRKAKKKIKK